jgi:K+-transporting ATPase KdpF subunit
VNVDFLVIGIIAFFVLLYLLYALIRPEKL